MKTQCSHCNNTFSVPLEFAGETVKCPKCKNAVETPALPTSPIIGYILACFISAALAGVIGFSCGALLTRTNREQTNAKILAIQTQADAEIEKARERMLDAQAELEQLEEELGRSETERDELIRSTRQAWNKQRNHKRRITPGEKPESTLSINISNLSFYDIRDVMKSTTEAQWKEYARSLKGKTISWKGWVEDVNEKVFGGYELWVDMDSPKISMSTFDVKFKIDKSLAMRLEKDQKINFQGTIESAMNVLGSCAITLENATAYLE